MARPPVLTKPQEKALRARVRAGADLPALQFHAQQKSWKVSRSVLGELLKDERRRIAEGEAAAQEGESTAGPDGLVEQLAELRRQVAMLQARMDGLISLPKVKLSDALTAAVGAAHAHLANPDLDATAVAKIMGELKGLAEAIGRAKEMEAEEDDEGDDELGV